jgi:hypothetical protein
VKVWLSGEIQDDVANAYREARRVVTRIIEVGLRERAYGPGLDELSLICIILENVDDHPEVRRYEKKDRVFDMRLQIPHEPFKAADSGFQRQMVMYTLLRCIKEMRALAVPGIDYDRLESDVSEIAKQHGLT